MCIVRKQAMRKEQTKKKIIYIHIIQRERKGEWYWRFNGRRLMRLVEEDVVDDLSWE